jgi:hypothetical protein
LGEAGGAGDEEQKRGGKAGGHAEANSEGHGKNGADGTATGKNSGSGWKIYAARLSKTGEGIGRGLASSLKAHKAQLSRR